MASHKKHYVTNRPVLLAAPARSGRWFCGFGFVHSFHSCASVLLSVSSLFHGSPPHSAGAGRFARSSLCSCRRQAGGCVFYFRVFVFQVGFLVGSLFRPYSFRAGRFARTSLCSCRSKAGRLWLRSGRASNCAGFLRSFLAAVPGSLSVLFVFCLILVFF